MEWYKSAVFYHIYPLGLLDAPKENRYEEPVHRLRELDDWIGHIKEIGCNALYIGPLFESVGHGYETTDYYRLDSRLGDNNDLKHFVAKCHESGIRVIFDGVFNHTGRDFFAFKDIQKNRENSSYKDWYCNVNFWDNNEYNDGFSYENWGGYNLLVKLNQRNPAVVEYICNVIRFWVSEFDIDGIRLDAADVLDFDFMKALRATADSVKKDFWLMGEVIHGDYSRWANGNTLHSVTNYVLHKALYSGHNDHNYFEIAHTVRRLGELFRNDFNSVSLYNFTDNHDVERITTKLTNKKNFYPVHILEYTLPGVPSIYYGSEFGIEGHKERGSDASLRPFLKYEDYKDAIENNEFTRFIAALGKARLSVKTLSEGDYREVALTNRQYVFTRNTQEFTCIVAVNNDENAATIRANSIRDGRYIGVLSGDVVFVNGGYAEITIPANYGEIYVSEAELSKGGYSFDPIDRQEKCSTVKNVATTASVALPFNEDFEDETPSLEEASSKKATLTGAAKKYGLSEKYAEIDTEAIKSRSDYENMSIEELQVGILEKMAANGPVNDQMIKTVMENVYHNSLINWIKSFR